VIRLLLLGLGFAWPYLVNIFWTILATLGVGWVTYGLVNNLMDQLTSSLETAVGGVPSAVASFAAIMGVGHVIACVVGGIATRFALNGIGIARKLIFRRAA
jgi:hypothetical protein